MIIYFCDRDLSILGNASTKLPDGFRITEDKTVEEVDTGVNTFSCVLPYTQETRANLEMMVEEGNYLLKQSAMGDADNVYDSVYQIIEVECDTESQEYSIYAEDAGLDLLNTLCPAVTLTGTIGQMLDYFLPSDWSVNLMTAPSTSLTYTWDGESTCTERLLSVVGLWNCELYYSFTIDSLQITQRIVNVIQKRGNQIAIPQLRLNYDLKKIYWKKSIADLVTAVTVKGGTPEGVDVPINLKNYTYSYTDPDNGDVYTVDKATGQMRNTTAMAKWASAIDPDGLLLGSFDFDTTDKAVLAGQARAYLQRHSHPTVTYEADFEKLPDDTRIGDRVNIIDDDGELYLEARLLKIESCASEDTQTATIGEYVLRDSGISEKVAQMASALASMGNMLTDYKLTITSSASDFTTTLVNTTLTANIIYKGVRATANMLDQADLQVNWYDQETGTRVGVGMTYTVTNKQKVNITARLEDKND